MAGGLVAVDGAHDHHAQGGVGVTGDLHGDRPVLNGSPDGLGLCVAGADHQHRDRHAEDPVQSDFALDPESLEEPDEPESEEPEELELPDELSAFEVAVSFEAESLEPSFELSFEAESAAAPAAGAPVIGRVEAGALEVDRDRVEHPLDRFAADLAHRDRVVGHPLHHLEGVAVGAAVSVGRHELIPESIIWRGLRGPRRGYA